MATVSVPQPNHIVLNMTWEGYVALGELLRGIRCKVNLIPYNPVPGLPYERPAPQSVLRFQAWLKERDVPVFIRKPKGLDIGSACGQLGAAEAR